MRAVIVYYPGELTKMKSYRLIVLASVILLAACVVGGAAEKELIAVLRSEAGAVEKCAACQQLRIYGTAESVEALAAMLDVKRVGHAARYALEGMPYAEAGAALRDALSRTSGPTKMGVVDSLGRRGDKAAIALLVPLLSGADAKMAAAAASALGQIGGEKSVAALVAARAKASGEVKVAVLEALLDCADDRLNAGDSAGAAKLYRDVMTDGVEDRIRVAAWHGLVLADETERPGLIVKALRGEDEDLRVAALSAIREVPDKKTIEVCVRRWDSLSAMGQLAVLDAHVRLGDAPGTIRLAGGSENIAVRVAAWKALADVGDASLIPRLVRAAASGQDIEKDAAADALARMSGDAVSAALLAHLKQAPVAEKVVVLTALGARGEDVAVNVLLENAKRGDGQARSAALRALRGVAAPESVMPLLDITANSESESERREGLRALTAAYQQHPERQQIGRRIIRAMEEFSRRQRRHVLPVLAEIGTGEALAAVQRASADSDAELSREAVRVLGQWPNAAAAPHLFAMSRSSSNASQAILALRGGITVAGHEGDAAKRLAMLREALSLARRPEEKRLVLSQLGRIGQIEALEMVLEHLDSASLVNEASEAAISIAEALAGGNEQLADEVAQKVIARCEIPTIVKRAWALRIRPGASGPFIRDWLVCGPYRQRDAVGALAVYNIEFGPEKAGEEVEWYAAPVGDVVALAAFYPGQTNCAAYLKAEIISPVATDAILLIGTDDGVKAWLNGELVHGNNIDRGMIVDEDMASVKLEKGSNELLLKVTQGGGGWSACARIVGADGKPIEGLDVKSQKDAPPVSASRAPAPKPAAEPRAARLPERDAYRKIRLSDKFYAEGAYYGDFNRDGTTDIVAGPFWFEGPDFEKRHEYRPSKVFDPKGYSDNFLTFTGDFNGDEWTDILCVPFPGKEGYWYANPRGEDGHWKRHLAHSSVGNESPMWGDVTGDGKPELLFTIDGYLGYAGPNPSEPDEPWEFHAISTEEKRYQKFTHGVGFGDINGDGRTDMIEAVGWWEQPANAASDGPWKFHPYKFADAAAQMLIYDIDGDGLNDVFTAWHCHLYGLMWYKQIRTAAGDIDWRQNVILSPTPDVSSDDFRASQLHAFDLVDMNGDGVKDVVTGKRFWAHGPTGDKEPDAPAIVLWFETVRDGKGGAKFIPHLIDDDSGVGTQVAAVELNGDGRPDIVVGNKKGIFVHLSESK